MSPSTSTWETIIGEVVGTIRGITVPGIAPTGTVPGITPIGVLGGEVSIPAGMIRGITEAGEGDIMATTTMEIIMVITDTQRLITVIRAVGQPQPMATGADAVQVTGHRV
jgi:hypothetical protein